MEDVESANKEQKTGTSPKVDQQELKFYTDELKDIKTKIALRLMESRK